VITYGELFAVCLFVGMGVYISYLRSEMRNHIRAGVLLSALVHDVADGNVEIERHEDGIRVRVKNESRSESANLSRHNQGTLP
jgi:hypothetical protein